jgi:hypothetical protein
VLERLDPSVEICLATPFETLQKLVAAASDRVAAADAAAAAKAPARTSATSAAAERVERSMCSPFVVAT